MWLVLICELSNINTLQTCTWSYTGHLHNTDGSSWVLTHPITWLMRGICVFFRHDLFDCSDGGWEHHQLEDSWLPFQWGCKLSRYTEVSVMTLGKHTFSKLHVIKKTKQNSDLSSVFVFVFLQDIWEQRLPVEQGGGFSQHVSVRLWEAPECEVCVHRPLCAASSLSAGRWLMFL